MLPRVGERPAGAERGVDDDTDELIFAMGDLDWMVLLGLAIGLLILFRDGVAVVFGEIELPLLALVRMKVEGLKQSFEKKLSDPLDLLANRAGSTFSESSVSIESAFRLPLPAGEKAMGSIQQVSIACSQNYCPVIKWHPEIYSASHIATRKTIGYTCNSTRNETDKAPVVFGGCVRLTGRYTKRTEARRNVSHTILSVLQTCQTL